MVTTVAPAALLIEMLFGTTWVVPPAQVSLAPMFVEWVTVPVGEPQLTAPVTLMVALPERVGSARLRAVTVYVPTVEATNVALPPLGVSVAPVGGVTLQETALEHGPLKLTVAVRLAVSPATTVVGFALTETPLTAQLAPPPPESVRSSATRTLFSGST
jgi:hypothetical protein